MYALFDPSRTLMSDGTIMENWEEHDVANALTKPSGTKSPVVVELWQEAEYGLANYPTAGTLREGRMPEHQLLISSAAASPAKTCPSPGSAPVSQAHAPVSSSSSPESSTLFDPDGYSSRTYPDFSPRTAVGTSESCLERWPSSGTAWDGGFSTAVSSECRSADGVCSSSEPSLTEILQPPQDVPARYSLSARAAQGILRRAEKRGRTLPPHLSQALLAVAGGSPETTSTGGGHTSLSGLGSGGPDDNDAQAGRLVAIPMSQRIHEVDRPGPTLTSGSSPNRGGSEGPMIAAPLAKGSASGAGVNAPGRRQEDDVNIIAFHPTGGGAKGLSQSENVAPGTGTGTGTGGTVAVAFALRKDPGGTGQGHNTNYVAGTVRSHTRPGSNTSTEIVEPTGVRRLTPIECERLQGLPDGWTMLDDTTPDSRRYSALGDAVTANVSEWIGRRLP